MDKKTIILETALRLFNERGFHNTPTSLIAKESGVSVGTLFNNFPTKEYLIKELYIYEKTRSKEFFLENMNPNLVGLDKFRDMWKVMIMWNLENEDAFRFIGQFQHSPFYKSLDHDIQAYKKVREFVLGFITNKEICISYSDFSFSYLSSIVISTTEYIKNHEIEDIDEFINMTFDLFWNGFGS